MAQWLQQSTSITVKIGPFLDEDDGKTSETGLTITQPDIRLSKNGGAFAQKAAAQTLTHDENGYYGLTLDGTDTDTLGRLTVHVNESGALPVWYDFMIIPTNVWTSMFGADRLQVHTAEISSSLITATTIAANAITAAKIASNAIEAAKIATDAITAAKIAANAIGATEIAAGAIDAATFATDAIDANALASDASVAIASDVADEVYTGATHNITNSLAKRIRQQQEAGTYSLGAVWIDTVNGVAGTTNFDNGTFLNPVDGMVDANTILASLNIARVVVGSGSTITFPAAQDNQSFSGKNWTLVLASRSIDGSHIVGAEVSGISTGTPSLDHCHLNACTFGGGEFTDCALQDTIILSGVGPYSFINCYHSEVGAPSTIDFSAGGSTEVHIHNWHGNLTILNMGAGDTLHFTSPDGHLTLDASCIGGTYGIAGTFGFTNNSSGMTETDLGQMYQRVGAPVGADISTDIAAIPTTAMRGTDGANTTTPPTAAVIADATWDEAKADHTSAASFGDIPVDLDVVRTKTETDIPALLPAALVSGRMDSNMSAINDNNNAAVRLALSAAQIVPGTVDDTASAPSTTVFQSDDITEATTDHYKGRLVIFTSGALLAQVTDVTGYSLVGGRGEFTVTALTEAPLNNVTFILV